MNVIEFLKLLNCKELESFTEIRVKVAVNHKDYRSRYKENDGCWTEEVLLLILEDQSFKVNHHVKYEKDDLEESYYLYFPLSLAILGLELFEAITLEKGVDCIDLVGKVVKTVQNKLSCEDINENKETKLFG